MPHLFVSDNGKTFKAAAKFIEAVFKDAMALDYLSGLGVRWKFNLEKAPWWGGVFERMIKSTNRCLRKMIGQAKFSLDGLHTAVVEVESIINSRPLSYLTSSDVEEPLTPSHLLIGRQVLSLPDNLGYSIDLDDQEFAVDSNQWDKRMKHLSNTLNPFWKRWRSEYLTKLRESHRRSRCTYSKEPQVSVGDMVIVHDESLPRSLWRLGKIEEVFAGRDGMIRGAAVKVASKGQQQSLLRPPIQLLYPLEVHGQQEAPVEKATDGSENREPDTQEQDEAGCTDVSPGFPDQELRRSSKRIAAKQADYRRRACMFELEQLN